MSSARDRFRNKKKDFYETPSVSYGDSRTNVDSPRNRFKTTSSNNRDRFRSSVKDEVETTPTFTPQQTTAKQTTTPRTNVASTKEYGPQQYVKPAIGPQQYVPSAKQKELDEIVAGDKRMIAEGIARPRSTDKLYKMAERTYSNRRITERKGMDDYTKAFGSGYMESASVGLYDKAKDEVQASEQNPVTSFLGRMAGYIGPGGIATLGSKTLLKPVIKKIVGEKVGNTALKTAIKKVGIKKATTAVATEKVIKKATAGALTEGVAGWTLGAVEGVNKGETPTEILARANEYGIYGGVLGGAFSGIGAGFKGYLKSSGVKPQSGLAGPLKSIKEAKVVNKAGKQIDETLESFGKDFAGTKVDPKLINKISTKPGSISRAEKVIPRITKPELEASPKVETITSPEVIASQKAKKVIKPIEEVISDPNKTRMADRNLRDVGNRKVSAYQQENPEVKPYFQSLSKYVLDNEFIPAKKGYSGELDRSMQGPVMKKLKETGMSYKEIEDGLDRVIKDNGLENKANAKRVEVVLDDLISNGFKTQGGIKLDADKSYIKLRSKLDNVEVPKATTTELPVPKVKGQAPKLEPTKPIKAEATKPTKVREFASNTMTRSTVLDDPKFQKDLVKRIDDGEFDYIQETKTEWMDEAVENIKTDRAKVINKLQESETISGGVMGHESAIITEELATQAKKTGDNSELFAWTKQIAEKSTETAKGLKSLDTAYKKTPAGKLIEAQRNVNKSLKDLPEGKKGELKEINKVARDVDDAISKADEDFVDEIYQEVVGTAGGEGGKYKVKPRDAEMRIKTSDTLTIGNLRGLDAKGRKPTGKAGSKPTSGPTGKVETTPSETLANKIRNSYEQTTKKKVLSKEEEAIMNRVVNELHKKAKESIPGTPNKVNKIGAVAEQINRQVDAGDIWVKAQKSLKEHYKNDDAALKVLNDYFAKNKKPPFSNQTIEGAFGQALKESDVNMRQLVKNYYKEGVLQRGQLIDYISANSGLEGKELKQFRQEFTKRWKSSRKKYSESYLESVTKKYSNNKNTSQYFNDVEAMSSTGGLKNEKFVKDVSEKIGKKMDGVFKKYVASSDTSIKDIVKGGLDNSKGVKTDYMKYISSKLDGIVDSVDKIKIMKIADDQFDNMISNKRESIIMNRLRPRKVSEPTSVRDFVRTLIDNNSYSKDNLVELIKKNSNLPYLADDEVSSIMKWMNEVDKLPANSYKSKALLYKVDNLIQSKESLKFSDYVRFGQRTNMLSSLKTVLGLQAVGNVANVATSQVARGPAIIADKLISNLTKKPRKLVYTKGGHRAFISGSKQGLVNRFKDLGGGWENYQALGTSEKKAFGDYWNAIRQDIKSRVDTSRNVSSVDVKRFRILQDDNTFKRGLNNVHEGISRVMNMVDSATYEGAVARRTHELKKINNVDDLSKLPPKKYAEILEDINQEGLYSTLTESRMFTDTLVNGTASMKSETMKTVAYLLMPFQRVPTNAMLRAVDYSPAGLVKATPNVYRMLTGSAKFDQKALSEDLGRAFTGTGLMILGGLMYKAGHLIPGFDDNVERQAKESTGTLEYSIRAGDKHYTVDWANPAMIHMMLGADITKSLDNLQTKSKYDDKVEAPGVGKKSLAVTKKAVKSLYSNSPLRNVGNLTRGYDRETENSLEVALNTVNQFVFRPVKELAKYTDDYERQTHSTSIVGKAKNRLLSQIPGREALPRKVDVWGNDMKTFNGEKSLVKGFLLSGKTATDTATPRQKDIINLYDKTLNASILPKLAPKKFKYFDASYDLNNTELSQYQRFIGKSYKELLDKVDVDGVFKKLEKKADNLTPEQVKLFKTKEIFLDLQKIEVYKMISGSASEKAKGDMYKWMKSSRLSNLRRTK